LDFSPWGGAYNRVRDDATAFAHRRELFSLRQATAVDPASSNEAEASAQGWLTESWKSVRPPGRLGTCSRTSPTRRSRTGSTPTTGGTTTGC
jgi:hypothetical protein